MPTPLPPKASIAKWKLLPGIIVRALFNPLVLVTGMTAVSLILGVLAITSDPPSKKVIVLCGLIGAFGLVAVIYEIRRLHRLDMGKIFISRLLVEGECLTLFIVTSANLLKQYQKDYPLDNVDGQNHYMLMVDWCKRTEDALRKYLDEGYVTRFHLGGSIEQDKRSMSIWKARHRLETLASFLSEIK